MLDQTMCLKTSQQFSHWRMCSTGPGLHWGAAGRSDEDQWPWGPTHHLQTSGRHAWDSQGSAGEIHGRLFVDLGISVCMVCVVLRGYDMVLFDDFHQIEGDLLRCCGMHTPVSFTPVKNGRPSFWSDFCSIEAETLLEAKHLCSDCHW